MMDYRIDCQTGETLEQEEEVIIPLDEIKSRATGEIKHQAETQRGRWITLQPGKIGEYRQKEAEVERWEAEDRPVEPDPARYPIAAAESAASGITLAEMLQTWEDRATAWAQASAGIAATERRALLAIEAAPSIAEVEAVLAAVVWPA
jgi:hypothetical protein